MKKTITKEFVWDCAHKLYNPRLTEKENCDIYGLCSNIHGHTYKMFITVSTENETNGMIINFKDLKNIVSKYVVNEQDHALNLTRGDPLIPVLENRGLKINVLDYETTCENQIIDFWNRLKPKLRELELQLEEIKLYETPTSYATLIR